MVVIISEEEKRRRQRAREQGEGESEAQRASRERDERLDRAKQRQEENRVPPGGVIVTDNQTGERQALTAEQAEARRNRIRAQQGRLGDPQNQQVFTSGNTGNVSGFDFGNRTLLGLNPDEAQQIAQREGIDLQQRAQAQAQERAFEQSLPNIEQFANQNFQFGQPQTPEAQAQQAQQQVEEQGVLDWFLNGPRLPIDPQTGEEQELISNVAPILPAGSFAAAAALPSKIKANFLGNSVRTIHSARKTSQARSLWDWASTLGGGLITGKLALDLLGIDFFREKGGFIQQSFNTLGEEATSIANDKILTPEQKLEDLRFHEQNILRMEENLQRLGIEKRSLENSREYLDIITDLQEKKRAVISAKNQVRLEALQEEFPELSEDDLADWIAQASRSEIEKVNKEYQKQVDKLLS